MENHLSHGKNLNHSKALGQSLQNTRQRFKLDNVKRKTEGLEKKADEVVRYMSNLPSYLERGEKQEKAFNVGVLEWNRLEKWQQLNQRQIFRESCTYSPSQSSKSRTTCTPPGRLRTYQVTKVSSPHGAKSSVKEDVFTADYVKVQQSILKTHKCFNKYTDMVPQEIKPNHQRRPQEPENRFVTSDSKGKLKVQDGDLLLEEKEKEKSKGLNHNQQTVVLLRPKDVEEIKWTGHRPIELPSTARVKEIKFPFETKRALVQPHGSSISPVRSRTAQDMSNKEFNDPTMAAAATVKVVHERALVHPRGPITFRTPEDNSNKELGDSAGLKRKDASVHPRVSSVSPVRSKTPVDKSNNQSTEVRNLKFGHEVDNKARNTSPFRRLSISMGRIVKGSSSDDLSGLAQNSNHHGSEKSILAQNTSCENLSANRKSTASPLRRLLDPFLKPKTGNSDQSPGSVPGPSASRNGIGESNDLNSVKVKLDLGSCKEIDMDKLLGSTTVQALLQVALKNGLPLYTFAVENSNDILAATVTRLSSSKKDGNNWIFTFFTVHEMKKKSGSWLNYASKERKQGYMPNVVGQMKVSDVQLAENFRIREFVLLGMNLRHTDEKSSDELAAIVLKLPTQEGNHRKNTVQKLSCQKSVNILGLTAILPGGQHGLPCNGKPSPLIERWRFGGSCDCGGWDLGCRLRIFTSETDIINQSSSDTSQKIHLYSQDQALERKSAVSLSPFKDGIYSVEFDSSLKLLQAFSICIAILNGLKPLEFLETSSFFQKKSSSEPNNTRFNTQGANIPACFVSSCPPGTPADRV